MASAPVHAATTPNPCFSTTRKLNRRTVSSSSTSKIVSTGVVIRSRYAYWSRRVHRRWHRVGTSSLPRRAILANRDRGAGWRGRGAPGPRGPRGAPVYLRTGGAIGVAAGPLEEHERHDDIEQQSAR